MARVWQRPQVVYDHIHESARESAEEVLQKVQEKLRNKGNHPYATGHLASTYRIETEEVSTDRVEQYIRSDEVYARAIEEGAWVKGGPGPHIKRNAKGRYEVQTSVKRYAYHMNKRLRSL